MKGSRCTVFLQTDPGGSLQKEADRTILVSQHPQDGYGSAIFVQTYIVWTGFVPIQKKCHCFIVSQSVVDHLSGLFIRHHQGHQQVGKHHNIVDVQYRQSPGDPAVLFFHFALLNCQLEWFSAFKAEATRFELL